MNPHHELSLMKLEEAVSALEHVIYQLEQAKTLHLIPYVQLTIVRINNLQISLKGVARTDGQK